MKIESAITVRRILFAKLVSIEYIMLVLYMTQHALATTSSRFVDLCSEMLVTDVLANRGVPCFLARVVAMQMLKRVASSTTHCRLPVCSCHPASCSDFFGANNPRCEELEEFACILPESGSCTLKTSVLDTNSGVGSYYDLACNTTLADEGSVPGCDTSKSRRFACTLRIPCNHGNTQDFLGSDLPLE